MYPLVTVGMAYDASDRYTVALSTNYFRVPAVEQEIQGLRYNDEVSVTLYPDETDVDSLTFTAYVNSGMQITIPVSIRRRFDLSESVTVSLEATGERWSPEVDATARKNVYEQAHPDEPSLEAVTEVVASADD